MASALKSESEKRCSIPACDVVLEYTLLNMYCGIDTEGPTKQ